ncbi:MAG: hypothetical protein AB7P37_15925 [Ramlibacter sp.]
MTSRVQKWFASAWGPHRHDAADGAAAPPAPNLDDIRQAMRMAVAPCSDEHRARATGQIARAASAVELWLLRSSLYQYLAQDLGQAEAQRRTADLLPLFGQAVPGVAARRQIADNRSHEQRLH